jgi:hypothetical protein
MEHEHKTQGDENRLNKKPRDIKRCKALNGWISSDGVQVSKPYSSEEFGHKQTGNYHNIEGGVKGINNTKF